MTNFRNPWNVQSLYELQFFNCPSCEYKSHSKQQFVDHAYKLHPDSVNILLNINDKSITDIVCPWKIIDVIKKEPLFNSEFEDPLKIDKVHWFNELNGKKVKCMYPSCSYIGNSKLFNFPQKDKKLRKKWLEACQLEDVKPNQKICYKHFNQYDISDSNLDRYRLRKGSIPKALVVSYYCQLAIAGLCPAACSRLRFRFVGVPKVNVS